MMAKYICFEGTVCLVRTRIKIERYIPIIQISGESSVLGTRDTRSVTAWLNI